MLGWVRFLGLGWLLPLLCEYQMKNTKDNDEAKKKTIVPLHARAVVRLSRIRREEETTRPKRRRIEFSFFANTT